MAEKTRIAFVAMKFESDHWRDKKYAAIREELEEVGYSCIRADQINTSGPITEEVCALLSNADLLVIDSSGDSHSVSYEIGFCHGAARAPDTTLLLRCDSDMPFNYQHYRHRIDKDMRHLRRLIRDFLKLYEPLSDSQYGYTFTFSQQKKYGYILDGARRIFAALRDKRFTGRCECFSREQFSIPGRLFSVGIMVRSSGRNPIPDYNWWLEIQSSVAARDGDGINLQTDLSELATKSAMSACFLHCGVAEYSKGTVIRLLGSDEESFFHHAMSET